jgi:dUTP pyrophosphatase
MSRHFYMLYVHVDSLDTELIERYKTNFEKQRLKVDDYLKHSNIYMDAGIDIFTPRNTHCYASKPNKVLTGLRCAMYFNNGSGDEFPCGFQMYPRSSTGSSTPLRLANSVGIIDAGYRGELMGFFDNTGTTDYIVETYQRILQICAPNLTYPIYPVLVDDVAKLDKYNGVNERGSGGFGSTGQ